MSHQLALNIKSSKPTLEPWWERRQKLDINKAARRNWRNQVGTMSWHRTTSGQFEGKRAVFSNLTAALLRAFLVGLLLAIPSLMLPNTAADTAQIVVVLAILTSSLIFFEYYGRYPSILEFRFAAPYNRLKFIILLTTILSLALICRGKTDPTGWTMLITNLGSRLGHFVDLPYSPVRQIILIMPTEMDAAMLTSVRIAAGISYTISMIMLAVVFVMVRFYDWPVRKGAFNVWVNLPLFDPTRGGDIVYRLKRDASVNIVLGISLPFCIPLIIQTMTGLVNLMSLGNSQTLIWAMVAWAYLPTSMVMRGIAMARIAELIGQKRKHVYAQAEAAGLQRA